MITVAKNIFKRKRNQKGQGIVEFLIFLPFIIMMYSVTMSLSNAINASINQQKITRAYWHYRNMNNSTIPRPRRRGSETTNNWNKFGMEVMGWSERIEGDTPVAPCYKFVLPLGESDGDVCDESYSGQSSQFIRVQTVYGMCGVSYGRDSDSRNPVAYPRAAAEGSIGPDDHCKLIN